MSNHFHSNITCSQSRVFPLHTGRGNEEAQNIAAGHKMSFQRVTHRSLPRGLKMDWGPNVTDFTVQIGPNETRLPVLRTNDLSSYVDATYAAAMDTFPVIVGNQDSERKGYNVVSLKKYLSNLDQYLSCKIGKTNLLKSDDERLRVSSQSSLIPKGTKHFNMVGFNHMCAKEDPAVLCIVSTSRGTSAQVIEYGDQKLIHNNFGIKDNFVPDDAVDDEMVMIVQVPLKTKRTLKIQPYNNVEASLLDQTILNYPGHMKVFVKTLAGKTITVFAEPNETIWSLKHKIQKSEKVEPRKQRIIVMGKNLQDSTRLCDVDIKQETTLYLVTSKSDSVPKKPSPPVALQKYSPATGVGCPCGAHLIRMREDVCYESYPYVLCDICDRRVEGKQYIYHCPNKKNQEHHPDGYDICEGCALASRDLSFNELNHIEGLELERDEQYPIRLTVQHLQYTQDGQVTEEVVKKMTDAISKSAIMDWQLRVATSLSMREYDEQKAASDFDKYKQEHEEKKKRYEASKKEATSSSSAAEQAPMPVIINHEERHAIISPRFSAQKSFNTILEYLNENEFGSDLGSIVQVPDPIDPAEYFHGIASSPSSSSSPAVKAKKKKPKAKAKSKKKVAAKKKKKQPKAKSKKKKTVLAKAAPVVVARDLDDNNVQSVLKSLGLFEEYYATFQENDIDDEALGLLEEQDLPALFNKLGPKVKFRRWLHQSKSEE